MAAPTGRITAVTAIRSSVRTLSKTYHLGLTIGLLALRSNPTEYKFAYIVFLESDLLGTNLTDLQVYKTHWGSLGKPEWFHVPLQGAEGP